MSMLDNIKGISEETPNNLTIIMGAPGSGKTTLGGTWKKPLLYVKIGDDGGGVVLKNYTDDEVKTLQIIPDDFNSTTCKHSYAKLMELLTELSQAHKFKSIVIDAYSSIEEELVNFISFKKKGAALSFDDRSSILNLMLRMRDKIVNLSKSDVEYVLITHTKNIETTDTVTGQKTLKIVPKGTENNGKLLMERAQNILYCNKKTVMEGSEQKVEFVTYVGAHPSMDTKIRLPRGQASQNGIYIKDFSYDKLKEITKTSIKKEDQAKIVEDLSNPFEVEGNKDTTWN